MAPVYGDHGYGGGTFVFREGLDPVGETLKSIANRAEPTALLRRRSIMRDWQKMNQKQRKELFRRVSVEDPGLDVIHPKLYEITALLGKGGMERFTELEKGGLQQSRRRVPGRTSAL